MIIIKQEKYYLNSELEISENNETMIIYNKETANVFYANEIVKDIVLFIKEGEKSFAEVIANIVSVYDIKEEQCKQDIENILTELLTEKILIKKEMEV